MLDNFHQSGGFAGAWAACENDFFDIAHSDFESNGELKFKFRHFLRIHPIITPKFTELRRISFLLLTEKVLSLQVGFAPSDANVYLVKKSDL